MSKIESFKVNRGGKKMGCFFVKDKKFFFELDDEKDKMKQLRKATRYFEQEEMQPVFKESEMNG